MVRMHFSTVRYTAGTAQLVPGVAFCAQLLMGSVVSCMGLTTHRYWMVPFGGSIMVAALLFMLRRGVTLPGRPILSVGEEGVYLHPCTGQPLNESYAWLAKADIGISGQEELLLLLPHNAERWKRNLPGLRRSRTGQLERDYGAPVALSERTLSVLCGIEVSLDSICDAINDNRLCHDISNFPDEQTLTTQTQLESGQPLYHAGEEARLGSRGICARVQGEKEVTLFPLSEVECIASMADYGSGSRKIVLVLAFRGGSMFGLLDSDPLFTELFEYICRLEGFDEWTFRRSISPINTQLLYCYQRSPGAGR